MLVTLLFLRRFEKLCFLNKTKSLNLRERLLLVKTLYNYKLRLHDISFFQFYYEGGLVSDRNQFFGDFFFSYKLNSQKVKQLPQLKNLAFRSTYLGFFKFSKAKKKYYLLNLYFLAQFRWSKLTSSFGQFVDKTRGWFWQVLSAPKSRRPSLECLSAFDYVITEVLESRKDVDLDSITEDWRHLRPFSWISLDLDHRILWRHQACRKLTRTRPFYKYWLFDGKNHVFQYKISCTIPKINKRLFWRKLMRQRYLRLLKAMLLRWNKHPVIFDTQDLKLMLNLEALSYSENMPVERLVAPKTTWQKDFKASTLKESLDDILEILFEKYRTGVFTEKLMSDCLYKSTEPMDNNVSYYLSSELFLKRPTTVIVSMHKRFLDC